MKEKKCDAMCKCNWGRTPLHNACCHDHIDVVKFMEVKCVEVNKRALDLAAQNGSMKVLRYMMKCYDPSEYNGLDTPLHYAASSGKEEVVQYLIVQQSFDCNAKGNFERTPLHSACRGGHLQVIEYLTKIANADLLWRDCKFDLTPLDLAAEHAPLNVMKCAAK